MGSNFRDLTYVEVSVDNPEVSGKQDELTRYVRFDHRETNTNDIVNFWKTMIDSLQSLT